MFIHQFVFKGMFDIKKKFKNLKLEKYIFNV